MKCFQKLISILKVSRLIRAPTAFVLVQSYPQPVDNPVDCYPHVDKSVDKSVNKFLLEKLKPWHGV